MTYKLATDGDNLEQLAWPAFLQAEFPSYERFWQKHVVPLTRRPLDIHFKSDAELARESKNAEDVAIAQLHYTILKHLFSAYRQRQSHGVDEFVLFVGLSSICGAQDVAFELLQRYSRRGHYDPWLEERTKGGPASGQDAQADWKKLNQYPLQDIRDYRNKLMHGRMPPMIRDETRVSLPAPEHVEKYCDWRNVTDSAKVAAIPAGDFKDAGVILQLAWKQTLDYFESTWQRVLLK